MAALIVTWCLLAIAAIVTASIRRFGCVYVSLPLRDRETISRWWRAIVTQSHSQAIKGGAFRPFDPWQTATSTGLALS
jgi:hypothetical protein